MGPPTPATTCTPSGAKVVPLGVLGGDRTGEAVRRLLADQGIPTDGVVTVPERRTPVKTRIMAGGSLSTRQQVVRVDREPEGGLPPAAESALLERLRTWAGRVDAVVLSDYGYGTITPRILEEARALAAGGSS